MIKNIFILFLFLLGGTLSISAQPLPFHTQDFRGLWVTHFRTEVLGNIVAENNLLSYAEDNDLNYLICTNMYLILGDDCGLFSSEMIALQAFIEKAHNDYGIAYISGNVGSATTASKMEDYNNCADVLDDQKFDMITYECEFYNDATNGSCPSYASFIGQLNTIRTICDNTMGSDPSQPLICETYIGGSGSTGKVLTYSSEVEMEEIASVSDHILLTYYRSTPFNSSGNFFNWTIDRLDWISNPVLPSNIVLLLKSRNTDSNNMYDYLHDFPGSHFNALRDPYESWVEGTVHNPLLTKGYKEKFDDGTYPWLNGIKVEGFTWFENEANIELMLLPLSQFDFNLELVNNKDVQVSWQSHEDVVQYELQRSNDQNYWKTLYKDDTTMSAYQYMDDNLLLDHYYYRIMMINNNDEIEYSPEKTIDIVSNNINVFPNPTTQYLNIENVQLEDVEYFLFDVFGNEIKLIDSNILRGNNKITLDLESLESGIYFLFIQNSPYKFIKL